MRISAQKRLQHKIIKERTLGILYPRVCPVCGKLIRPDLTQLKKIRPGEGFPEKNPFICATCASGLKYCADSRGCLKCSRPLEDERTEYCPQCMRGEDHFDFGIAALVHDEAAGGIMYGLKYQGLRCNAEFAAFEMVKALESAGGTSHSPLLDADVIIPVPLHKKREFERGYNQAGLLAKELSLLIELHYGKVIPVDDSYLIRTAHTPRLKSLTGSERAAGIAGAFRVNGEAGRYRTVLLVDDIYTTGATLSECAKTLRQTGAAVIYFITVTIGA